MCRAYNTITRLRDTDTGEPCVDGPVLQTLRVPWVVVAAICGYMGLAGDKIALDSNGSGVMREKRTRGASDVITKIPQ
jgi:hypothetical protein